VFADLVNRADVGMIERRRRSRLAPEALQRRGIVRRVFGKKLQRGQPAEQSIFGRVDDAHAAAAERRDQAIVRDGLTRDVWFWRQSFPGPRG
jgi:hypothetical protein